MTIHFKCAQWFFSCEKQKYTVAVDHRDTPLQVAAMHNWNLDWTQTQIEMKVIREAIYKSIRNDANYSAEEMKKDVVKQFQDQYLLKVIMFVMIHVVLSIIDNWMTLREPFSMLIFHRYYQSFFNLKLKNDWLRYFLQVAGSDQYFLADCPISQYKYVWRFYSCQSFSTTH